MSISSRVVTSIEATKTKEEVGNCRKELHAMVKRLSAMKRQLLAQKEYIEVAVKDALSVHQLLSASPYTGDKIVDYRVKLYKHRAFIGRFQSSNVINSGETHSLALDKYSKVYSFGKNDSGQLGRITDDRDIGVPAQINTEYIGHTYKIIAISAGGYHSLVLREDGKVFSFGDNGVGQLGDGPDRDSGVPAQINTEYIRHTYKIIAISAGYYHSLVLREDGKVFSFGDNSSGRLGRVINTADDRLMPTEIPNLNNIIAISAGYYHSLVLREDGKVFSFGSNEYGQLGNGESGTSKYTPTPTEIPNLNNIIAISAGAWHSLVLREDGEVFSFGYNSQGQLGRVTNTAGDRLEPAPINTDYIVITNKIIAISAGGYHSLVLREDGKVFSFGYNSQGQLGDGGRGTGNYTTPSKIPDLNNIIAISAGGYHNLVFNNVKLYSFGLNEYGQLGNGESGDGVDPVLYNVKPTELSTFMMYVSINDIHASTPVDINEITAGYARAIKSGGGHQTPIFTNDQILSESVATYNDPERIVRTSDKKVFNGVDITGTKQFLIGVNAILTHPNNISETLSSDLNRVISPRVHKASYSDNTTNNSKYEAPKLGWNWSTARDFEDGGSGQHMWPSLDSFDSWHPRTSDTEQWLQLNLKRLHNVVGVVVQARGGGEDDNNHVRYVKEFTVYAGMNRDIPVDNGNKFDAEVTGIGIKADKSDRNKKAYIMFKTPITTQYISVFPKTWEQYIAIRLGVIVSQTPLNRPYNMINDVTNSRQFNELSTIKNVKTASKSVLSTIKNVKTARNTGGRRSIKTNIIDPFPTRTRIKLTLELGHNIVAIDGDSTPSGNSYFALTYISRTFPVPDDDKKFYMLFKISETNFIYDNSLEIKTNDNDIPKDTVIARPIDDYDDGRRSIKTNIIDPFPTPTRITLTLELGHNIVAIDGDSTPSGNSYFALTYRGRTFPVPDDDKKFYMLFKISETKFIYDNSLLIKTINDIPQDKVIASYRPIDTYNPGTKHVLSTGVLKGLLMQGNENITGTDSSYSIEKAIPSDIRDYTISDSHLEKIRGFGLD